MSRELDKQGLADLAWPMIPAKPLVLVPVGSIEQHGPHLPLDTDTTIAVAVAEAVAASLVGVVVAPALTYGSSGEHQSFAGTSSIGTETLRILLVELVRSMSTWAGRIVFVNAHGGNLTALSQAATQMIAEQHVVAWAPCVTEDVDLHAGLTETSLMLHLRPQSVDMTRAAAGNTSALAEIVDDLRSGGVAAVSANGVLGDPAGANAVDGQGILNRIVDDVLQRIRSGPTDARGMLANTAPEVSA